MELTRALAGEELTMKLSVDRTLCSGHGRCYTVAPAWFDCDDEGFSVVLREDVPADDPDVEQARLAVASCPERAIRLEDS